MKLVFDDFFRFMGFFCTGVIAFTLVVSSLTGNPPEFPLFSDSLLWLVFTVAAFAGAYARQRNSEK
jgi:hypothetical protein